MCAKLHFVSTLPLRLANHRQGLGYSEQAKIEFNLSRSVFAEVRRNFTVLASKASAYYAIFTEL